MAQARPHPGGCALGIGCYAPGWGAVARWLARAAVQPIPSIADLGSLAFCPAVFVAIVRIMHQLRIDRSSILTLLDAIVAGDRDGRRVSLC